ncbi:MAG TPA: hypothetical protein VJR48_08465, partial [Ktedonobacterales bacterium]|nr:hypothetical protein [Ktedonobacterales bacterium]
WQARNVTICRAGSSIRRRYRHRRTAYNDLRQAFHVGKYSDIPESDWLRVAEWIRVRTAAAEKQRRQRQ